MSSQGGSFTERRLTTAEIGSPANRWAGENRGGWSNTDYDRIWEAFTAAPDRGERTRHFTQLMRLLSENLPSYMMYFAVQVTAFAGNLHGPDPGVVEVGTLTPVPRPATTSTSGNSGREQSCVIGATDRLIVCAPLKPLSRRARFVENHSPDRCPISHEDDVRDGNGGVL